MRIQRLVFGVGYVLMGAFGTAALGTLASVDSAEQWYTALFAGGFFALIGISGLLMLLFPPLHRRYRPAAVATTAPSGAPALFFRRSPFMLLFSVVFCLALGGLLAGSAVVLHGYGQDLVPALLGATAAVLLWPVAVATTGRIVPGGLWLTPDGLEYRKEAVGWTLPWSALAAIESPGDPWADVGVLPQPVGRGVAALSPVVLRLRPGARPEVRRGAGGGWDRECRAPDGMVCVDCFDLAGGRAVIAATVGRCLADPGHRVHLGTEWSLPRQPT